jgi:hypothetical protein
MFLGEGLDEGLVVQVHGTTSRSDETLRSDEDNLGPGRPCGLRERLAGDAVSLAEGNDFLTP